MANDIKLGNNHPLSKDLLTMTVGDRRSSLEIADVDKGARVRGELEVTGGLNVSGTITGDSLNIIGHSDADIILVPDGQIYLDANHIYIGNKADPTIDIDENGPGAAGGSIKLMSIVDRGDYCELGVGTTGITTLTTVDDDGEGADLILNIDGYVDINSASGENITLDSGSNILYESATHYFYNDASGTGSIIMSSLSTGSHPKLQFNHGDDGGDELNIQCNANGASTISTVDDDGEVAHLTLAPDGDTIIDRNTALTSTGTAKGLEIDYDHVAAVGDGQTLTGMGIDIDMNCESGGGNHANSIVNLYGVDADMVGATDGTQSLTCFDGKVSGSSKSFGLRLDVSASGLTSTGIYLDNKNGGTDFKNVSSASTNDYFTINTIAAGVTTLATVDGTVGATAHLSIVADGHVEFDNCGVGFDKLAGTFGTSAVIGSPNDGTDIDFRLGNKYELILSDHMGSDDLLNFIFPAVSGNFLLVLVHDPSGGYDIHDGAWKAYAADGSLADSTLSENGTDGEVRWAGGATPTLSANGRDIDIISIYWDADEQTALAMASLDFAAV